MEQGYGTVEEIEDFDSRGIGGRGVAGGGEGVDASAVFIPFVLPEVLGGAGVGEPVGLHGGEEGGGGRGDY